MGPILLDPWIPGFWASECVNVSLLEIKSFDFIGPDADMQGPVFCKHKPWASLMNVGLRFYVGA